MTVEPDPDADWTQGVPRILYSTCRRCGWRGYLPRHRCPSCGSGGVERLPSGGLGTVTAVTVVHQASGREHDAPAPFGICLVELDERVRAMGRCAPTVTIGERVRAGFPQDIPHFEPVSS
jgi:uncharacterized protein